MSATENIRVMLVEDHTAFREALAFLLSHEPDIEVVAQAGWLAQAREALLLEGAWTWRCSTWPCPTGTGAI